MASQLNSHSIFVQKIFLLLELTFYGTSYLQRVSAGHGRVCVAMVEGGGWRVGLDQGKL